MACLHDSNASQTKKRCSGTSVFSSLKKDGERTNSPSSHGKSRGANLANSRKRRIRERKEVEDTRLGAMPFIAAVNLYLKSREGLIAPSTYKEENKKLRYISRLFDDLKANGKVLSTEILG